MGIVIRYLFCCRVSCHLYELESGEDEQTYLPMSSDYTNPHWFRKSSTPHALFHHTFSHTIAQTLGIVYNPSAVSDEDVKHWSMLLDSKYKRRITMKDSVRDSYIVALGILNDDHCILATTFPVTISAFPPSISKE